MNEDRCFTPDYFQGDAGCLPAMHKQLGFSL